jgi:hypothetical protein
MKTTFFTLLICLLFISFSSVAQNTTQEKPTEVLLFGTFHFNNPGLDLVKTQLFPM